MDLEQLDSSELSREMVAVLRAKLKEGRKHLKYYYDTMVHFKHPERRMKCFDTVMYEREVPQIEQILTKAGKL